MTSLLTKTINTSVSASAPKIKADNRLRAFRQEAQLSWPDFNQLWMDVSNFLNSPAYDILLDVSKASQPEYCRQMREIACDVLCSGLFGPKRQGTWAYGRYDDEPDLILIADFVASVTAYAASGIMAQVSSYDDLITIESDKVGGWLMNEEATEWENYEFVSRVTEPVSNRLESVSNGDYPSTSIIPSRARSPSCTIKSSETACVGGATN